MKYLRFIFISIGLLFNLLTNNYADEGQWIPLLLGQTCFQRMKELGCRLTADDIYSVNHSSLKDAVVLFNHNCTGVLISGEGLLLTNRHCGYTAIRKHSTPSHNYLKNGFWAMSKKEEIPDPGLSVSFLIRMKDVTEKVLEGITDSTSELKRTFQIQVNIEALTAAAKMQHPEEQFVIKPLYNGNQFYLYEYKVFRDVRLVATPPASIGNFGGESDNWMWPRQTGDFALFRVYANKKNQPADYAPDNVPYKPKKFLTISLDGVKQNEFTMVYGYPADSDPFLTAQETAFLVHIQLPQLINIRSVRLSIMAKEMFKSQNIKKVYKHRFDGISSSLKKWQGEEQGLIQSNAIAIKRQREAEFSHWLNQNPTMKQHYGDVSGKMDTVFREFAFYSFANRYTEEIFQSIDLITQAGRLNSFIRNASWEDTSRLHKEVRLFRQSLQAFYATYDPVLDKKIFEASMYLYYLNIDPQFLPSVFKYPVKKEHSIFQQWAEKVYAKSILTHPKKLTSDLKHLSIRKAKKMLDDPAIRIYDSFGEIFRNKILVPYTRLGLLKDSLTRVYTEALREYYRNRLIYPEANQTLRLSFGTVKGYKVRDAVNYRYYSTLKGVMQKEDTLNNAYRVPEKLKKLYQTKDYGSYADRNGNMRICFISTSQTSGGSSGSPVMNASGELIGLNFDRNREGTMSEVFYDPNLCRNISVDIRYILFIIDKYAHAGYLLHEMRITNHGKVLNL